MDEKISLKALEDYSDDYASKVTASFFSRKEKITGPEILRISEIQQVNLFIIRELLHAWKLESQKLRSPYFDYSSSTIAEALQKFQNLLSNHISITRENFQPLLKKATTQSLFLILDPYDFFSNTLDAGTGGSLKIEDLRAEIKYIRINRVPLEKLLTELEKKKLSSVPGNEAFAMLDHILEEVNFTPEDIEDYVKQFSKVVPLPLEEFYIGKEQSDSKSSPIPMAPISSDRITPPTESKKPVASPATLYDQLTKVPATTLAEDFQKKRKIKDSLTINQKFMFTKILFNGDFELFSDAVDRLDQLDDLTQAKKFLSNNYGEWNSESEEYQEFMEVVESRFS